MDSCDRLLLIDIGNTNVHIAWVIDKKLVKVCQVKAGEDLMDGASILIERLIGEEGDKVRCLISHVNRNSMDVICEILDRLGVKYNSITPILIHAYAQRNGLDIPNYAFLGSDLFCDIIASWERGRPSLIVDGGTCLKVLGMNEDGRFLGGSIAPGRGLMLSSINSNADLLNVSETFAPQSSLMLSSDGAVSSGLSFGYASIAKGLLEKSAFDYGLENPKITITGGDCAILSDSLVKLGYVGFDCDSLLTLKGLAKAFGEVVDFGD